MPGQFCTLAMFFDKLLQRFGHDRDDKRQKTQVIRLKWSCCFRLLSLHSSIGCKHATSFLPNSLQILSTSVWLIHFQFVFKSKLMPPAPPISMFMELYGAVTSLHIPSSGEYQTVKVCKILHLHILPLSIYFCWCSIKSHQLVFSSVFEDFEEFGLIFQTIISTTLPLLVLEVEYDRIGFGE